MVDLAQPVGHRMPDHFRRYLAIVACVQLFLNVVTDRNQCLGADLTFVARLLQAVDDVLPFERLARAILFYDRQPCSGFDMLIGGESFAAVDALPAPANGVAVVRRARIDYFVIVVQTKRTAHDQTIRVRDVEGIMPGDVPPAGSVL
jgi:hypothetical protein